MWRAPASLALASLASAATLAAQAMCLEVRQDPLAHAFDLNHRNLGGRREEAAVQPDRLLRPETEPAGALFFNSSFGWGTRTKDLERKIFN